jgi:chromosome segregation ATPase
MAEAFIETLTNKESIEQRHKADLRVLRQQLVRMERRVVEHKNIVMPRKLSSIGRTIGAIEKRAHLLSIEQAKETISELNSILNNLEIELAGVQAKLVVIKQFQDEFEAKGEATNETMEKVEQMFIEQAIQVEALKARKNVATSLREQAENFCITMAREENEDFYQLRNHQEHLEEELFRHQQGIRDIEEKLALLDEDVTPLNVYQNKVTIYPVRVDE